MTPTFVIGDAHGHIDRLEALMIRAGLLVDGQRAGEAEVVHLGDLGHFNSATRDRDRRIYETVAIDRWVDRVLWGNHDYAAVGGPPHSDYVEPDESTRAAMAILLREGRLSFALARHGRLLTHAGLSRAFKSTVATADGAEIDKRDVRAIAAWIDGIPAGDPARWVIDAVSPHRGGGSASGGVLWRDVAESLWPVPQVFGHSVRRRPTEYPLRDPETGTCCIAHCIDVGNATNGRLCGMWLPSGETVEIAIPTR